MAAQKGQRRLIYWFALVLILCASLPVQAKEQEQSLEQVLEEVGIEPVRPTSQAPPFSLSTIGGDKASLGDLKGRLVLLHFWATWSKPAPFEMANLEKLQRALDTEPFTILAIATDTLGRPSVEAFVKEYAPSVPVLLDTRGEMPRRYALKVVPTSVLIDGQGRVIGLAVGARLWGSQPMIDALKKVLGARSRYGIKTDGSTSEKPEGSR